MAFSVSIGDALLLAKIAWRVGQTFTSGRHSAPAEFTEVQNLLYTLSKSLELLAGCLPPHEASQSINDHDDADAASMPPAMKDANAILQHMVLNCSSTLTHLETLVGKYTELEPGQKDDKTRLQRWKAEIWKTWKKVVWTKEGGDIAKLKCTLTAHISGLNMAVNAVGLALGRSTNEEVSSMNAKLDSLAGLLANIHQAQSQSVAQNSSNETTNGLARNELTFAIYVEQASESKGSLLCPMASFVKEWLGPSAENGHSKSNLFKCECERQNPSRRPHQRKLNFFLLPITLLVKKTDSSSRRRYQTYVGSPLSTSPVSLYISDIPPKRLRDFEDHLDHLAVTQASNTIRARTDSMLLSHISSGDLGGVVAMLNMTIGYVHIARDVLSISITSGGRSFNPPPAKSLQVLHYKFTPDVVLGDGDVRVKSERIIVHQSYVELIITCNSSEFVDADEPGGQTYTLNVFNDTSVEFGEHSRIVAVTNVTCNAKQLSNDDVRETWIQSCTLNIEFRSSQSASRFRDGMEAVKRELLILYLQRPSFGDHVIYVQGVGDTSIYDYVFTNATLTVVYDMPGEQYRLILLSGCYAVSACLELPSHYVQKIPHNSASIDEPFPARFVRVEGDRTTIHKRTVSIRHLLGQRKVDVRSIPFRTVSSELDVA